MIPPLPVMSSSFDEEVALAATPLLLPFLLGFISSRLRFRPSSAGFLEVAAAADGGEAAESTLLSRSTSGAVVVVLPLEGATAGGDGGGEAAAEGDDGSRRALTSTRCFPRST